ncbi:MAG: zinc-binding dehydrogenase [Rhodospirillales bacterium]|nr:zinc-binding dehydrogenase [Rhodospirillales bacterium]
MTAAVMHAQGLPAPYVESRPFHIEEVDLDGPGEGEVLVEVRAAGLCHSDLSQVAGLSRRTLPVIGGHEGAGIVRELGAGVDWLRVGDHVVITVATGCGHCRLCADNRGLLCESVASARGQGLLTNGRRHLSRGTAPYYHYAGISSFAQYAVVVPSSLVRIDPAVPLNVASLFGCAVVTGAGCVFNAAKVRPGQSVAVLGLGGVGLNAVMAARASGASEIIGIDINSERFNLARELGCTATLKAKDPDLVAQARERSGGGVDFAFEISGSPAAMATATAITRKGGEVVCVGLGSVGQLYQYSHASLVLEVKVFRGTFMGSCVPERDIPRFVRLYQDGKLPVDRVVSGTMGFADLNGGLDHLDRGEAVRQILLPHG